MRADWTQYDPAITAQLASLNRSGVPSYVVYPAKGQPNVLPELLTKDLVLEAIKKYIVGQSVTRVAMTSKLQITPFIRACVV